MSLENQFNLDPEKLKEIGVNAMYKAAEDTIKSYYNDYDSPFKKLIREQLKAHRANIHLEMPGILGLLNDRLNAFADQVANESFSKLFIPEVSDFLLNAPTVTKISELVALYAKENYIEPHQVNFSAEKHPRHGWISLKIGYKKEAYNLTLHYNDLIKKEASGYVFLSLPYDRNRHESKMVLRVGENASLELPYRTDVLRDRFTNEIAKMVLARTLVELDFENLECEFYGLTTEEEED